LTSICHGLDVLRHLVIELDRHKMARRRHAPQSLLAAVLRSSEQRAFRPPSPPTGAGGTNPTA
jgi:hypothetical protein